MTGSRDDCLRFHLPRGWWRVPSHTVDGVLKVYDEILLSGAVRLRNHVEFRRHVREQFEGMMREGVSWKELHLGSSTLPAHSMLMSLIIPDTQVTMTPAIGNSANAVLSLLEQAVSHIEGEHTQHFARRPFASGETLRSVSFSDVETGDPEAGLRVLTATYWFPIPETKRVLPATFTSPFGLTPFTALSYADALVRSAELLPVAPAQSALAQRGNGYDRGRV